MRFAPPLPCRQAHAAAAPSRMRGAFALFAACCFLFGAYALSSGCSTPDRPHAPAITPGVDVTNPAGCDQLRESGATPDQIGRFPFDGGVAECLADGQYCSIGQNAQCEVGVGYAQCLAGWWVVVCAGDASVDHAAQADAEAGEDRALSDSSAAE